MEKKIVLEGFSKSYGSHVVFKDVNISFNSGHINGLIGVNGAGKSTLLNCLNSICEYDGTINKTNINSIACLCTEPFVFPRTTGKEFLQFCQKARCEQYNKELVDRYNSLFKLPLEKYADTYSSGMLKKLHILSIIMQNTDAILLDEPFNGLDIRSSAIVTEIIKKMAESGTLVIISSHDLWHLSSFCDSIYMIDNNNVSHYSSNFDKIIKSIEDSAKEDISRIS